MFDKKGMILMETLLFFSITLVLTLVLLQCAMLWHSMEVADQKGYRDEEVRKIYQP